MLQTYLLLEADGERIVLVQKLYRWLARTRVIEKYTEILRPCLDKLGTHFLQTLKKLLWRKAGYLES